MRLPTGDGIPVWRRGFPFFLAKPRTAVERLRSAGAWQVWKHGPLWKRSALAGVMAVGWPAVTFMDAVKLGARRAKEGQSGFLSSFGELYGTALTRNIPPNQSALYRSEQGAGSSEISDFLLPLDLRALKQLSLSRGARLNDVQDKARFEQICRQYGLPCVRTLAAFDHGKSVGEDILRGWTQPFFVKALTGNQGAGAELWRPGGRGFVSSAGDDLTIDELIASLRPQNCIVQPALEDDTALKALGTVALSSVRIITAKGRTIPSTPIAASLSLAVQPGSLTGHDGITCGIDIASGTIVKTTRPVEDDDRVKATPIGFTIPHWSECVALVRRAHDEAFPAFVTLGWDLALTADGPVLLETNVNWGMTGHQRLAGPLGKTALADVIDELLEPAPARRSEAGPR